MTGCTTCDRHGPELDGTWVAWLNLHRILHEMWRAFLEPIRKAFL